MRFTLRCTVQFWDDLNMDHQPNEFQSLCIEEFLVAHMGMWRCLSKMEIKKGLWEVLYPHSNPKTTLLQLLYCILYCSIIFSVTKNVLVNVTISSFGITVR